jgi:hypothetical protein
LDIGVASLSTDPKQRAGGNLPFFAAFGASLAIFAVKSFVVPSDD